MKRRHLLTLAAATAIATVGLPRSAWSAETIKVGILHSLSGTMATAETPLKDIELMAIEEINAAGGVLGRQIEPVIVDPASNWPLFAEKARQLITRDKVAVVFGCWTSVSRKSVLPVFEELGSLLVYPLEYEGEELSKNIFYMGAAPNLHSVPAAQYLLDKGFKRFYLLGTDYVYPRTTNKVLKGFLKSKGVAESDITERYTPFSHKDYKAIVEHIKGLGGDGKTAVISTLNGDTNVSFYNELAAQGVTAGTTPVIALSIGETELSGLDLKPLVGHMASWSYFMSLKNPTNDDFNKRWAAYARAKNLPGAGKALTMDPMEAAYLGVHLWKQAVEKAQSTDVNKVIAAMAGQSIKAPSGFQVKMDDSNHHMHKPSFIGEIQADGQFKVVWKSAGPQRAQPWSPYIPGNEKRKDAPERP